jgi:hypothetical protein
VCKYGLDNVPQYNYSSRAFEQGYCVVEQVECPLAAIAQILSTKPTSARANFGSSYRTENMYNKAFEHKLLGGTSKGVTTEVKSGFGRQVASQNINAPLSTVRLDIFTHAACCTIPA